MANTKAQNKTVNPPGKFNKMAGLNNFQKYQSSIPIFFTLQIFYLGFPESLKNLWTITSCMWKWKQNVNSWKMKLIMKGQ